MTAFFSTSPDGSAVMIQMRAEGEGLIGDYRREVRKGDEFYGLTFADLQEAGSGTIEFTGDRARIVVRAGVEPEFDDDDLREIDSVLAGDRAGLRRRKGK